MYRIYHCSRRVLVSGFQRDLSALEKTKEKKKSEKKFPQFKDSVFWAIKILKKKEYIFRKRLRLPNHVACYGFIAEVIKCWNDVWNRGC